jgi:hypothetical protein
VKRAAAATVLAFALGGIAAAGAATPRRTLALATPRQGKIAIAVLRFSRGRRPPALRLRRRYSAGPGVALVGGVARLPRTRTSYLGLVAIVDFPLRSGDQSSTLEPRALLSLSARRGFTLDYAGDPARYRGRLGRTLAALTQSAWRLQLARLASPSVAPGYHDARTLLDQVRRAAIGKPDPRFLAVLRGATSTPPAAPPPPPAPPPAPPPPPVAPGPPQVRPISSDPFTNTTSQHRTQVEPDSFAYGSTIVATFQSGRFFDGGSSGIGFATSTDAGPTWTKGFLPSLTANSAPAGPYPRASDPSVAYDASHHVWLIESLAVSEGPSTAGTTVLVSRSSDGLTWGPPVVAGGGANIDKTWIVCDNGGSSPYRGHCYSEWDDVADGDRIKMSTSTNGGLTWSAPLGTADNAQGFAGQPVVQPNGDVVVPILNPDSTALVSFGSTDGGASWSGATPVATIQDHQVAGGLRSEPVPSAEVDAAGTVYVAWQDCRFRTGCSANDIVYVTKGEGGSWSQPTRVRIDPTTSSVDHFIPGLAVDPATSGASTKLALAYYYYPDASCPGGCQLDVGLVTSGDAGATWSAPEQLGGPMSLDWLANTSLGRMVGDYVSTSFSSGVPHPFFALAHAPTGGTFDEAIYTR